MKTVHSRIKQELADSAYSGWKERNGVDHTARGRPETPVECEQRHHIRSQPSRASTCDTCSQAASQLQSAVSSRTKAKAVTPIKMSLVQTQRNVGSVGRPDKLYPYINYPPKDLRRHSSSPSKAKGTERSRSAVSSRSPSQMSGRSTTNVPTLVDTHYCDRKASKDNKARPTIPSVCITAAATSKAIPNDPKQQGAQESDAAQWSTQEHFSVLQQQENVDESYSPKVAPTPLLGLEQPYFEVDKDEMCLQPQRPDDAMIAEGEGLPNEDWDDDEDELGLFHDVGHTNSLNALALPNALTKGGKSAAEVVQLLRFSASFGQRPKNVSRTNSYSPVSNSRGSSIRNRFQRRFSLGAIPEGQMVMSYSDEEASTTHLLDDQFFTYSYPATFQGGNEGDREGGTDEYADEYLESLVLSDGSDDDAFEDEAEDLENSQPASLQNPSTPPLSKSDTLLLPRRQSAQPLKLTPQGQPTAHKISPSSPSSLKIINFAWDPESSTVGYRISAAQHLKSYSPSPSGRTSPQPPTRSYSPAPSRRTSPQPPTRSYSPSPRGQTFPQPSPSGRTSSQHTIRSHSPSPGGRTSLQPPTMIYSPSPNGRASPQPPGTSLSPCQHPPESRVCCF